MKNNTKNIVLSAVFTAVLSALSQVAIPLPAGVSITLQTFAVALLGYMLSPLYSFLSILVYIILGTIGVPVFANFRGGIDVIFGVSGGFILGFAFFAVFCSFGERFSKDIIKIIFGIIGLLICHICGIAMFAFVMNKGFLTSAKLVSLPFIIKDIISVICAYCVKDKIKNSLKTR